MSTQLESTNAASDRPILPAIFRRAAGFLPTGVAILSTPETAMTVSSLHCVSFDPPLITVALGKDSSKARSILDNGRFRVRVLRNGEELVARGEGFPGDPGMVEMDCVISAKYSVGDHDLIVATVGDVRISGNGYPIIYWRRGLHAFQLHYDFLASREAFQEFVAEWEAGTLPKARWAHASHVAIGAYYAVQYPSEALERTRNGIIRYNAAVGTENSDTSGYHETLTRLWANILAKFVDRFADPWEAVCAAVAKFGEDRDLHSLYYSFDVVHSIQARRFWIPPDLDGPSRSY